MIIGQWLRDFDCVFKVARYFEGRECFEFHVVNPKLLKSKYLLNLKNVFFHKNISDEELKDLYSSADILFMPLKDATANNAVLEAISCGLPVLTTDLPGTRAYLFGKEARLIKQINGRNDYMSFVKALIDLKSNPKALAKMSISARKKALSFDWSAITKKIEKLYLKLILQTIEAK